jgi:uncharacterized membrane protein
MPFAAAGAAAMYLLDPSSGRRRRARARAVVLHEARAFARGLRAAGRDLDHRARGLYPGARNHAERDDGVVEARVRSRLGHACSHAHALVVSCRDGVVELAGPVLEREAAAVLTAARATTGVRGVVDHLERRSAPGLRGAERTAPRRRGRWTPAERLVVGGAGAAAIGLGLVRRGATGFGALALGGVALARALANLPLAELGGLAGRRPAIDVVKTITIHAPVQDVHELFTMPENFPRFMRHVKEVRRVGENRWRWTVGGPGGVPFEWEGFFDRVVPNELVSWKSTEGASVANEGTVVFETISPGVTRLTIRLRYWPPGGLVGHEIAHLLGGDPKRELDEDMMRLKSLVELGKTKGSAGVATWDDVRMPS